MDVQPAKAVSPMLVKPSGKETEAREVQLKKAARPMLVKPSGRETEAREVH